LKFVFKKAASVESGTDENEYVKEEEINETRSRPWVRNNFGPMKPS
jgi:hypothetical protein